MRLKQLKTIAIPLYGSVELDEVAVRLIDTPEYQRLRQIRQLGYAYWVYPGAVHQRFEHPLGVYHLVGQIIQRMLHRGELESADTEEVVLVRLAALLHDIAHWPLAHLLEEGHVEWADHEAAGQAIITNGRIGAILGSIGIDDAAEKIAAIIRHESTFPLAHLVAGSLDADGLDYLRRDAHYCDLPLGFNQGRLVDSLVLMNHPRTGAPTVMLYEKGLGDYDDWHLQRYRMYKNVYWHRTVRSASVMGRGLVVRAVKQGVVGPETISSWRDEDLIVDLSKRLTGAARPECDVLRSLVGRLSERRLYKMAVSVSLEEVPILTADQTAEAEKRMAAMLGLKDGEVLVDIPSKPGAFRRPMLILRKNGDVVERARLGTDDGFISNEIAPILEKTVGRARVFTARPVEVRRAFLVRVAQEVAALR